MEEEKEADESLAEGEEEVMLLLGGWIRWIRCLDRDPFLDFHQLDQRPVNPRNAIRTDPYHGFRKGAAAVQPTQRGRFHYEAFQKLRQCCACD